MIGEFQDDLKFQSLKMDFLRDDSKITHRLNILKRNRLQGVAAFQDEFMLDKTFTPFRYVVTSPSLDGQRSCLMAILGVAIPAHLEGAGLEKAILDVIYLHRYKRSRVGILPSSFGFWCRKTMILQKRKGGGT